jgi:hypothetical protein
MFSLQNGPDLVQGTPNLVAHATTFYKDLFGSQQMSEARMRDDIWSDAEV